MMPPNPKETSLKDWPKDMLGLRGKSEAQLTHILDTAVQFRTVSKRAVKKVPTLRGRTVIMAFFENSTRTKLSFEVAAKRLSADVISFSAATSSSKKGKPYWILQRIWMRCLQMRWCCVILRQVHHICWHLILIGL